MPLSAMVVIVVALGLLLGLLGIAVCVLGGRSEKTLIIPETSPRRKEA